MEKQDNVKYSNRAIVLGLGITGLGVIRNLGRNGIETIGVDTDPLAIASFSRYCAKRLIYKDVVLNEKFADYLGTLAKEKEEKCVLIPAEDRYVRFISEYEDQLKDSFIFVMPDKDLCQAILNKRLFYELAAKYDAPIPRTYFPLSGNGDIVSIADEIQYPCVIKPVYSKEWDFASTLKGITASTPNDLIEKYSEVLSHNSSEVLIQEVVPGRDDQQYSLCAYFNRDARPLISFVARKVRQHPAGFGVGTYVESVREPEVERIGIDFLEKIKYKGVAEVEFRRDSRDDKFKLIEINARSWTQNTLPTKSGVNMIYLSYLDTIGKFNGHDVSYKAGVKWINDFRDIFSSLEYIKKKELSLTGWIKSLKGAKEFAVFSWDDLCPFVYFPIYSISRLLGDAVLKLKSSKPAKAVYWSYFFIKNEGILFFLKLFVRKMIRYEHFIVMARDFGMENSEIKHGDNIDIKMATDKDIRELQLDMKSYAFENYRNHFSKVKTCFLAYYKSIFAALSWVYFKEDGYKYYKVEANEAIIGPIYTRDEFRGRGVAPELVNDICRYLKSNGYDKAIGIVSTSNHPSIRMFEKSGFSNIGNFRYLKLLGLQILPKGAFNE